MRCPFCNYEDTRVIDSRPSEGKKRRRRECPKCGKRFTTYEVVEKPQLMVYKRDGSFEPFDRQKLIKGIQNAIKKRPVSVDDMKNLVDDIENTFANKMQTETTTSEIGDMVLMGLKKLDHVAYVRFASVYKDFSDVDSFIQIITELSEQEEINKSVPIFFGTLSLSAKPLDSSRIHGFCFYAINKATINVINFCKKCQNKAIYTPWRDSYCKRSG